jgi:hypothetical protein
VSIGSRTISSLLDLRASGMPASLVSRPNRSKAKAVKNLRTSSAPADANDSECVFGQNRRSPYRVRQSVQPYDGGPSDSDQDHAKSKRRVRGLAAPDHGSVHRRPAIDVAGIRPSIRRCSRRRSRALLDARPWRGASWFHRRSVATTGPARSWTDARVPDDRTRGDKLSGIEAQRTMCLGSWTTAVPPAEAPRAGRYSVNPGIRRVWQRDSPRTMATNTRGHANCIIQNTSRTNGQGSIDPLGLKAGDEAEPIGQGWGFKGQDGRRSI